MRKLLCYIISAGLGLWLAVALVSGVSLRVYPHSDFFGIPLATTWHCLALLAIILGLINYFVKPILNTITLPLRIITLGLFGFVVNMGLLWAVDYLFLELDTPLFFPLFWTTLIIWALNLLINKFILKEET